MKFTWFNLMPWPDLPDDFREQHRSVWVDIDSKLFDPARANAVYHEYMDQLEYADELGFDGIGVNEHHQNGYGIMPSPNIIAAGLARRTSRAAICVIGNSIALYNPPIRVAEEFAMLDCISGGRLVAGFPVGTSMDTNFCYGQIPALTRDKYAEAHELIMRAWTEDEPFAFDGKYNQLRYVNCWPKPIQKPHPPVYIPGGGSIETWDFCLDHDYNYSYLSFGGYLAGKKLLDGYWDRVAARDKDESPYRAAFAQIICVAETDEEAERLYSEHMLYFFNRCLHVYPGFSDAPGYRTIDTIKAGALDQFRASMQKLFSNTTWGQLVEAGHIIAGSPETVIDRMKDMITTLRVGHVFCLMHNGDMPDWKTRYSSKLFAERVMPHLRDMWPEWADDDRWWIHPLEDRVAPEVTMADARRDPVMPELAGRRAGGGGVSVSEHHDPAETRPSRRRVASRCEVLVFGSDGPPVVAFHGVGGHLAGNRHWPRWRRRDVACSRRCGPASATSRAKCCLEDMLDFALHGADVVHALGLEQPHLYGHSFGGMIAAEMVAIAPESYGNVGLVAPAGLWLDEHPMPDIYAMLPFEFPGVLFHDPGGQRRAADRWHRLPGPGCDDGASSSPTAVGSAPPARSCSRSPTAACPSGCTG